MSTTLEIRNGPSKADLLRSVTNVAKGLTTTFETDRGPIEAQIESPPREPERRRLHAHWICDLAHTQWHPLSRHLQY